MSEKHFTASDRWFVLAFVALTAVNVLSIYFTPLDLSADEAQYAGWSKNIDWAYYSKGPAIAVLIRASTILFGSSAFAVRLPVLCCHAFFSLLLYVFIRQLAGARVALASWLASRSMLIFAQMGLLATTDAPAALMWLVAIICAHRAVVEEESPYWIGFGAATGLGVLAKYSVATLYPSVFLLLFFSPHLRRHLLHPAFIAGVIIFLFALFPLIKWNADHGWVNFVHNGRHLSHLSKFELAPHYFLELLAGQLGLVGPIIFVGIVYAFIIAVREWKEDDRASGLLLFFSVPLGVFICVISLSKRVYPNWPLPIYIGGLVLLAHLLANYRIVSQRISRLIQPAILFSAAITTVGYFVFFGFLFGLPPEFLPSKKLVGWRELGAEVDQIVLRREKESGRRPFVIASEYQIASEIEFYAKSRPGVLCDNLDARRMNQYDIWDGWTEYRGRDAIIVLKVGTEQPSLWKRFREVTPLPVELPIRFGGKTVRTFHFFLAREFNGEPPPVPDAH